MGRSENGGSSGLVLANDEWNRVVQAPVSET